MSLPVINQGRRQRDQYKVTCLYPVGMCNCIFYYGGRREKIWHKCWVEVGHGSSWVIGKEGDKCSFMEWCKRVELRVDMIFLCLINLFIHYSSKKKQSDVKYKLASESFIAHFVID